MMSELNSYKVHHLSVINEHTPDENENVKLTYKYGLREIDDTHFAVNCIGMLHLDSEPFDQNEKTYYIELSVEGFFTRDKNNTDTKELRKYGAAQLLPFLASHLATAMASVGLDPIIIPLERIKDFNNKI